MLLLTHNNEQGDYTIFQESQIQDFKIRVIKELGSCKISLEETVRIDDEADTGFVSMENMRENFEVLDLNLEEDLMEFVFYWIYQKSENAEKLKYSVLFTLLEEEIIEEEEHLVDQDHLLEEEETPKKSSHHSNSYEDEFDQEEEQPKEKSSEYSDQYVNDGLPETVEQLKKDMHADKD